MKNELIYGNILPIDIENNEELSEKLDKKTFKHIKKQEHLLRKIYKEISVLEKKIPIAAKKYNTSKAVKLGKKRDKLERKFYEIEHDIKKLLKEYSSRWREKSIWKTSNC